MHAAKMFALIVVLLALTLPAASCDKAANAQVADGAPGRVLDIEANPDIVLTNEPATDLRLNGVKLGDDVSAIPGNIIKFKRDDHLDCINCTYTIVNGKVWSMSFTDRQKLSQIEAPQTDPDLIQMRLGKADQIDTGDDDNAKGWKGYWFTSKRSAVFLSDEQYTGWVAITVCR